MQALDTIWRKFAGALMALTLAMFVFGPTLDALICQDETTASATAMGDGDILTAADEGSGSHPAPTPDQPCAHGHCHHGGQSAPMTLTDVALIEAKAERPDSPVTLALATRMPSGLERPPRA